MEKEGDIYYPGRRPRGFKTNDERSKMITWCRDCLYCDESIVGDDKGVCRKKPPVINPFVIERDDNGWPLPNPLGVQPFVDIDHGWCGEGHPRGGHD